MKRLSSLIFSLIFTISSCAGPVIGEFTSQDGGLVVYVPDGWTVLTVGDQFTLATSEDVLFNPPAQPAAGEAYASVFVDIASNMGIEPQADSPGRVLERFAATLEAEENAPSLSEIREFELNGRPAALITVSYETSDQVALVVEMADDRYGFVNITCARNTAWQYEGVARSIAASLRRAN